MEIICSAEKRVYRGGSTPLITNCGVGRCPANARLIKILAYERNRSTYISRANSFSSEKRKEYRRRYKEKNPHQASIDLANRRARKKSAAPQWLTTEHLSQIAKVYRDAKTLEIEQGIPFDVDHIVPLSGKTVCGLHVPWNLRAIPRIDNQCRPRIWVTQYDPPHSGIIRP